MTPKTKGNTSFTANSVEEFEKDAKENNIKIQTSKDGKKKTVVPPADGRRPGMIVK